LPVPREPNPADLASRATVAAAFARGVGGPLPEHEIDELVEFDPKTGRYLRDRQRPDADGQLAKSALKPRRRAARDEGLPRDVMLIIAEPWPQGVLASAA